MNQTLQKHKNVSFNLQQHQVQKLDDVEPGMTVVCDKGIIWLTESNNRQDYALKPGHKVLIREKGEVIIEAINEAHLHIIYPN
jgi:hypothetical protein